MYPLVWGIDPLYILFALPAIILVIYAQIKVKSTYNKYLQVPNSKGVSGLEVARALLDTSGLRDVSIEGTSRELGDHYDPRGKVLRLSPGVARSRSVAAMGIVAHEVGHAVQDARSYIPLRVRSGLVPIVGLGSGLGYIFFLLGILAQFSGLVWLGIALFSSSAIFALVTLPVERNASKRALGMLQAGGVVTGGELEAARSVLSAAALTYVAALAQAISTLLYYIFLATGMTRRDE